MSDFKFQGPFLSAILLNEKILTVSRICIVEDALEPAEFIFYKLVKTLHCPLNQYSIAKIIVEYGYLIDSSAQASIKKRHRSI
jgi:hypothetical protein